MVVVVVSTVLSVRPSGEVVVVPMVLSARLAPEVVVVSAVVAVVAVPSSGKEEGTQADATRANTTAMALS